MWVSSVFGLTDDGLYTMQGLRLFSNRVKFRPAAKSKGGGAVFVGVFSRRLEIFSPIDWTERRLMTRVGYELACDLRVGKKFAEIAVNLLVF